jgi:cullin 3
LKRYSGRRLNFQFDKGRADVQVFFTSKTKKILTVSTYQMILLSLFNNKDTLTYQEILEQSGIPREECFLQLLSMVHPTVKVLRKAPNTKDVEDDHKFAINPKYTNPRTKVNIPIVTSLRPPNPNAVVEEEKKIQILRRHQIDAAIVRIMKSRKTLKHTELVTEVANQLRQRFMPLPGDIKKRICSLIELDYMERDENDKSTYHYKQ